MKRYIQYEPFNIYCFDTLKWQHPIHNHTYFEIIFIRKGSGEHFINGNTFPYATNDVFLLGPEDYHYFEIKENTSFCYIRFTEIFIKNNERSISENWLRIIEFLIGKPYLSVGSLVKNDKEKELLNHLLVVLIHEYTNRDKGSYETIINGTMRAILSILSRNIARHELIPGKEIKRPTLIEDIWFYIDQHIQQPDKLRIEQMVKHFNYSSNYLSVFFKKKTGESLQHYILKHKFKMIENRLMFSDLSISEITHEFGFTDESHLNKLFRKYSTMTPGQFRNRNMIRV